MLQDPSFSDLSATASKAPCIEERISGEQPATLPQDFPIVGVGASAGGLKALEEFFDNMPSGNGAAFVVIQHLSPDFKSLMNELLERHTQMDVCVATEGMPLAPNAIFLIPPGQNIALVDNCLHLTSQERSSGHHAHFPIDLFFKSLAEEGRQRIISIVLSGTGSDGTRGIQAVSESGGIVLVQDPITAEFDGMPQSAIATGLAELVLPPHAIASATYQLVSSSHQRRAFKENQEAQINPSQLQQIVNILESCENIDFTQYKPNTLNRRISRRSLIAGHSNLNSYIRKLQSSETERARLRNDLLITVTRFFRNSEAWDFLEHEVLPALIERATPDKPLRIWVTACATGEEAYSIAMLVHELLEACDRPIKAKIFATDIDAIALAKASAGIYPAAALDELSEARRERFFTARDTGFEIARSLREMIIFANHNLIKDAAFTQMDLVSCRNVLIYMQLELQQQVLRNLHFSLKPGSTLFLGKSENLGELEGEFETAQAKWKIYRKIRNIRLPFRPRSIAALSANQLKIQPIRGGHPPASPRFDPLIETVLTGLLRNRKATCFLVDRDNQLMHLCSDSLNLLKVSTGRASQDAVRMLPESIQFAVSTALYRAHQKDVSVAYKRCHIAEEDIDLDTVTIEISQEKSLAVGTFLMVTIEKDEAAPSLKEAEQITGDEQTAQYIVQLQQELQATRENLQATIEELETTNEEQQSTNEELIAANEELQSTNEELHSVNEEMHTVNTEYQSKIQELVQLNNDLDNLLTSVDIGVIFLDKTLKIRQFNPAATLAFNLVSADIDRPLEHFSHNLESFEISEVFDRAQHQTSHIEQAVKVKQNGPYLLLHIHPYLNETKDQDGWILTTVNVDDIKQSQDMLAITQSDLRQVNEDLEIQVRDRTAALESSEQLLQSITQATPNAIYIYDLINHKNLYANAFLERMLGYSADEILAMEELNAHLFHPEDLEQIEAHHEAILNSDADNRQTFPLEYRIRNAQGEWRYFYSQDIIFARSKDGKPTQILGTAIDMSEYKSALTQIQQSENRYRSLYQRTPAIMHSVDPGGTVISTSNQWLSQLGYQRQDVVGRPIADFLDCEDQCDLIDQADPRENGQDEDSQDENSQSTPCKRQGFSPRWLDPEGCHKLPCHLTRANGSVIDVQLSTVAEQDAHGNFNQLLAVMVDVSDRNRAEAELKGYRDHLEELVVVKADEIRQANQQLKAEIIERQQAQTELAKRAQLLERSNASLEEFAYVVSHDLQEPLRAMTVFSQLLEQRYQASLDSTAIGYLDNVVQGGVRMQALIDGILDFSRITHCQQKFGPVDLQSIIKALSATLQPTLTEEQATLTYSALPTVVGDSGQIAQVFQNLISNAIKFRSSEPPEICIQARPLEVASSDSATGNKIAPKSWLISVQDNGIGIPKDQQSRVFTLFQRLHTRQEKAGYGIGLSICKKIVERHQGRIWVESEAGEGTTFYFTLEVSE